MGRAMSLSVALLAVFAAVAVRGDQSVGQRNLLQIADADEPGVIRIPENGFPFCACDRPPVSPIDIPFRGYQMFQGKNYACFSIVLKNPNPATTCRYMDVYKVEFDIRHPRWSGGASLVDGVPKSISWADGAAGSNVLKITQLSLTQVDLAARGTTGYPICWSLPAGKSLGDVSGLGQDGVRYSVFNKNTDCCPIGINNGLAPVLVRNQPMGGTNYAVTMRLYVDPVVDSEFFPKSGVMKLEFNSPVSGNQATCRQTVKNAYIDGRPMSATYENDRQVFKFTNLGVAYKGVSTTATITFELAGCSLDQLCFSRGACLYAPFNTNSQSGLCPVNTFPVVIIA